jgi:hypothetical protein
MKIETITLPGLALLALSAQVTQARILRIWSNGSYGKQTRWLNAVTTALAIAQSQPLRHRSAVSVTIIECQR